MNKSLTYSEITESIRPDSLITLKKIISDLTTPELAKEIDLRFNLFTEQGYSLHEKSIVDIAPYSLLLYLQMKGKKTTDQDYLTALQRQDLDVLKLLLPSYTHSIFIDSQKELIKSLRRYIPYKLLELDFIIATCNYKKSLVRELCRNLLASNSITNPADIKMRDAILEKNLKDYDVDDLSAAIRGHDFNWIERISRFVPKIPIGSIDQAVIYALDETSPLRLFQILDDRDHRPIYRSTFLVCTVRYKGLTQYLLENHPEFNDSSVIWWTLMATAKVSTKSISYEAAAYILKFHKFTQNQLNLAITSALEEDREDLVELFTAQEVSD